MREDLQENAKKALQYFCWLVGGAIGGTALGTIVAIVAEGMPTDCCEETVDKYGCTWSRDSDIVSASHLRSRGLFPATPDPSCSELNPSLPGCNATVNASCSPSESLKPFNSTILFTCLAAGIFFVFLAIIRNVMSDCRKAKKQTIAAQERTANEAGEESYGALLSSPSNTGR
jgi:hypothetical protein